MYSFLRKGAAIAASAMLSLSVPFSMVRAEETSNEEPAPSVFEGVKYNTTITKESLEEYRVVIDIEVDEETNTDTVMVHPFYDLKNHPLVVQAGDTVYYEIHLNDSSKMNYEILDGSATITSNIPNTEEGPMQVHKRTVNDALVDLGVMDDVDAGFFGTTDITKAVSNKAIAAKLKTVDGLVAEEDKSLSNDEITNKYLGKYYLSYYNAHINEGDPIASFDDLPYSYIETLFNGLTKFAPGRKLISDSYETSPEVKYLHYLYAVRVAFTLDGTGIMLYTPESEIRQNLENKLKAAYNTENPASFTYHVDLYAVDNSYQNTKADWELSLMLVKPGIDPDKKISEPDLVKTITGGENITIGKEHREGDYATVGADGTVEFTLSSHVGEDLGADGTVEFTLSSHVGEDLAEVIKPKEPLDPSLELGSSVEQFETENASYTFTFVDHMDSELTLLPETVKVLVNGKEVTIPAPEVTDSEAYSGRKTFSVTLDLVDLFEQGYFTYEEIGKAPIVLTYKASTKDQDHIIPATMKNTAWVTYQDKSTEPSEVDVDTFGVKIFKYDQLNNQGLAGAKFDLYAGAVKDENKIAADLISGSDGFVSLKGLKEGTYYLVETEAPTGYNKSDKPLEIIVNKDKDDETYYVNAQFANAPEVHTGGAGTAMFTIGGSVLILAGAAYYMVSKKRRAE